MKPHWNCDCHCHQIFDVVFDCVDCDYHEEDKSK